MLSALLLRELQLPFHDLGDDLRVHLGIDSGRPGVLVVHDVLNDLEGHAPVGEPQAGRVPVTLRAKAGVFPIITSTAGVMPPSPSNPAKISRQGGSEPPEELYGNAR